MYVCFWNGRLEMGVGCFFSPEVLIYCEGAAFDSVFTFRPQKNTNATGSSRAIGETAQKGLRLECLPLAKPKTDLLFVSRSTLLMNASMTDVGLFSNFLCGAAKETPVSAERGTVGLLRRRLLMLA